MSVPRHIVYGPHLGGAVLTAAFGEPYSCPSLADLWPYAPPVDRSEQDFSSADPYPATRINYDQS